ncbi:MAG: T9SS type A sorting domain-containing protein [Bacteroidetes bacterium]|nr:T9SS type A sorting domain-containing protein [Bacteroidota bacterium]
MTTYYPPSSQTGNVLTWNFSNLQPGYVGYKSIELNVPSFLAVGTTLHFEATVFPVVNDTVPSNNFAYNNPVVTGSYDPNDKLADPELITPDMLDEELPVTYTIRFQNTGNDTAFNVQIIDTLSENLDIPTFELLGSSHPCSVDISGKGIIEFSFNNILLPDSTTDEMNSHGFVRYSVKPIDTLALGETVVNTAYIYFDFNEAIVTNTVVSEVRDTLVAIPVFRSGAKASLTVFPNPYRDETNIQYSLLESGIVSLEVFDIVGKNVATLHDGWQESGQYSYIFSAKQLGLPSGIYVVKLNMSDGCVSRKIVEMR